LNTFKKGGGVVVVGAYAVYVLISIGLTIWVGRTLSRHGEVFLRDVFSGDESLVHAVNRLLIVGFYLLNLGYVAFALRIGGDVPDLRSAIESLSTKIGMVLFVLGAVHLANVFVLSRVRLRRLLERQPRPPVPASGTSGPVPPWGPPPGSLPPPYLPPPAPTA
jgi:hypothetical protein